MFDANIPCYIIFLNYYWRDEEIIKLLLWINLYSSNQKEWKKMKKMKKEHNEAINSDSKTFRHIRRQQFCRNLPKKHWNRQDINLSIFLKLTVYNIFPDIQHYNNPHLSISSFSLIEKNVFNICFSLVSINF